jgi:hypothetical protein
LRSGGRFRSSIRDGSAYCRVSSPARLRPNRLCRVSRQREIKRK